MRRDRNARRVALLGLTAFLALGLLGVFGSREDEVSAAANGYELDVRHPAASRSGLSIDWRITVRRDGGFDGPVTLATSGAWVELLDENAVEPTPASSTTRGEQLVWEFDPPAGDTLVVRFDGRIDPSRRGGADATTTVLEDGRPMVAVDYGVTVFP